MQHFKNKKILIAPLDWGLGHATRCIPIINEMLQYTQNITIAATGIQLQLLQSQFPNAQFISIPNYNIKYGKNKLLTIVKLLLQINKINKAIKKENKWLQQILLQHSFDIVISDNRYGLYNKNAFCIFITHQLKPKTILGNVGTLFLQKQLYMHINQFTQCWVMDNKGKEALAGALSNPTLMPTIPTIYIGTHTRLQQIFSPVKKYTFAIILSGPEPQRTVLENIIIKQLSNVQEPIVIVRGTNIKLQQQIAHHIEIISIANAQIIENIIAQSQFVLCRSGYTSLMDYLSIGAKCIVVSTPGQSEQTYLAQYTSSQKLTMRVSQKKLEINTIIAKAKEYSFKPFNKNNNNLTQTIATLFN